VARYCELFRPDWRFASGELVGAAQTRETHDAGEASIQVVPSGPDVPGDPLYDALLTAAFSACRRLWVVTPYFIPDEALCRALVLAAHRGVDVRLVVPRRSNHRLADMAGRSYLREVRAEGGKVLFYNGMLHAKGVLIDDDLAILGSANIDMRSLLLNYEAGLFVYSEAEIRTVEQWMQALLQGATSRLPDAKAVGEIMEGLARLFAPQL
jgi:cardiolipin synthase